MDAISDIQRSLKHELGILAQDGGDVKVFLAAGMKAIDRLGAQSDVDEQIKTFLSAATLFGSYNAFIALNQNGPKEASRRIVQSWQDCVRRSKECPAPTLDAKHLLQYHDVVSDFLDAEVGFGKRC